MKCEFYFKLAPVGWYRQGTCTFRSPSDFQTVADYCERAGLWAGSRGRSSFTFRVDESDDRLGELIQLLAELERFPVWSSFSPFKGDVRYFCVKRYRVFSDFEMEQATFFTNVEWGSGLICAGKYADDGVVCVADSFDRSVKAGWVSVFGGGFLVRNEVREHLEERELPGLIFREVRFDIDGFMKGEVWELASDRFVAGCLLPAFAADSDCDGKMYEVFQYDDSGMFPVQLKFKESYLNKVASFDFVSVKHETPSVRWSTAHSFLFSKKMIESLEPFRGRFRWSPVAVIT